MNKLLLIFFLAFSFANVYIANAATTPNSNFTNINNPEFRLVICDGPRYPDPLPVGMNPPPANYVPCDFNGLMLQANQIITLLLIAGVFVAIAGLAYSGYLFLTGKEQDRTRAKEILPKIAKGFIMMISAWFIVHQLLIWLTDNGNGFSRLIGG